MKRVFLAIQIPFSEIIDIQTSDYQKQFGFMNIRWVEPKYLHMTLKFFGPTSDNRIEKIKKSLENVLVRQNKFEFSITKLRMFGSRNSPKVLWWGIDKESELKSLVASFQKELDTLGLYSDRQNFVPHITLGRIIKVNSQAFFQKQIKRFSETEIINVDVNTIVLMESRITELGPEYIEIAKFNLA